LSTQVKRLYKDFKPESYDLQLSLHPSTLNFEGKVKIKGKKTGRPSNRLTFHQKDLNILSAAVIYTDRKRQSMPIEIVRLNRHSSFDEIRLHSRQQLFPGEYTVEMTFSGKITDPMDGIYPSTYEAKSGKKIILTTQFESHHARQAFPCIDEPEAKATFELTIETDSGLTTISNTDPVSTTTKTKRTTTKFAPTPIMSTYLLVFVSGEIGYQEAVAKSGTRLRVYSTPENVKHLGFSLETAVRCLDFFSDYFEIAYPLEKCDLVALPDFASGAMENWGCITFREQCLVVDKRHTSLGTKQFVALVVAHELAHQWFGNLVTMRWWTDLWLNEGFASWIEYLACNQLFPEWQLWTQFLVDEREQALKLDALKSTHPIEVPVAHPDEIRTIFDAISYSKGASVINMLHEYLGPDDFKKGLNHYLTRHAYKNTDTVDLWQALEDVSKKPVKDFMHAWTSQPGFPVLLAEKRGSKIHVEQTRFLLSPNAESDDALWPIPLLRHENSHEEVLTEKEDDFHNNTSDPILYNRRQTAFYRVAYHPSLVSDLTTLVRKGDLGANDRLGLLSDSFETARAGMTPTVQSLRLLENYADEADAAVWDVISGSLASIRAVMDTEELREAMKPYMIGLATKQFDRLGWSKKPSEPHSDQLLRPTILAIMAVSDEPTVVKEAMRLFKAMHEPDDIVAENRESLDLVSLKRGAEIDPDFRGIVYGTVARHGGEAEFNKLLKMHNASTNSEERSTIAAALTGFKQPELVNRALAQITTDDVRLQDVLYWTAYSFMNRFARKATWEWLKVNWDWLLKHFRNDLGFYRLPTYAARAFSDEKFLVEFNKFFEPKRSPAFDRSIDQAIETINWHSAWRKRDLDLILGYFTSHDSKK